MPCFDSRGSSAGHLADEVASLRNRNNKLMRVICTIDKKMGFTMTQLNSFGDEAKEVILRHRRLDKQRG